MTVPSATLKPAALGDTLSVAAQIGPDDVAEAARLGFRSIIGNRPDGEAPDQPAWAAIEAAAQAHGLQARHLPVVASTIDAAQVDAFAALLRELPAPVLAYCRTGTRSSYLWALANVDALTVPQRVERGARAGYDLGPLLAR